MSINSLTSEMQNKILFIIFVSLTDLIFFKHYKILGIILKGKKMNTLKDHVITNRKMPPYGTAVRSSVCSYAFHYMC